MNHTTEWSGKTRGRDGAVEKDVEVFMHHNGDFSGDVHIVIVPRIGGSVAHIAAKELTVPFAALAELVGQACMLDTITQLEDLTGAQFLGLEPLDEDETGGT